MKVEKRSGGYRFQKMINGKRYSFTLDHNPTKKEIEQLIAEKMNSHVRLSDAPKTRFIDCANEYMSINENVLSPSTKRGYASIIRNIPEWFADTRISDIDQITVQKLINEYSVTHAPKTTKNLHGFVSVVLQTFNPSLVLKTNLPQKKKTEDYIPTNEEVSQIMELVQGTRYYVPFRLGAYGLRRSEICALQYPEDFEDNIVHINKALVEDENKQWIVKQTKTVAGDRYIYIDDELLSAIKEQGYIYNGFPGSIYRHLQKCQAQLGIQKFRLHDMRHYFATELSNMGVPEADILAMGGWSTPDTMKRVYRHSRIRNNIAAQKDISEKLHQNCTT